MVKVKKLFSLLAIVLLMLNNAVFAQYTDASYYEGRPIDKSREGIDYYREGDVIVYPGGMGSSENDMMERFRKGDIDEGKMREIAKEKFGEEFDEIEFEKGMLEMKERAKRKEAFSYEHSGFGESYYMSPSYEGYSKEHMIYGMVFEHIGDDIDPREIKQYCSEPDKVADIVIKKFKEKVGDLQSMCKRIDEQESKCLEYSKKGCSQLGTSIVRKDATDMEKLQAVAYSCPPDKDAIIEACRKRSMNYMEQRMENAADMCKKRFDFEGERLLRECRRFNEQQVCDKEKYIERCMGGAKKEDFERKCPEYAVPACGENSQLKAKTDSNGCTYYYCESVQIACTADVQQCPDGSYVSRDHSKNCEFKPCPTMQCPEPTAPTCASGQTIQKKTDDKGCAYYYCEAQKCPEVSKPVCNSDEHLQAYYGNAGCITSYQCIRQTTCPTIEKPLCAEGQSMTTRYDDKGCISGYECIPISSTGNSTTISATGSAVRITGRAVLSYDDFMRQCEGNWLEQERICSGMQSKCDKESFIQKCREQENKNNAESISRIEQHCELYTDSEARAAEQRCAGMDMERQKCIEQSGKRCSQMKGMAQQCREFLTEENLRKFKEL